MNEHVATHHRERAIFWKLPLAFATHSFVPKILKWVRSVNNLQRDSPDFWTKFWVEPR